MLVTNAIARGHDAASSMIVESWSPRATSSSRVRGQGLSTPSAPWRDLRALFVASGARHRSRRRQGADRACPGAYTSEQALSKPFLKNREKEG